MTYLQILYQTRDNIQKLIKREEVRKQTAKVEYEQKVARVECVAARSCNRNVVSGYKMCSLHLHKAAKNNDTYRRKRGYKSKATN